MRSGVPVPHPRTAVVVGGVLVVLYLLLSGVVLLVSGGLGDRFGTGPVFLATAAAAVLTWFGAGWFGSASLRAEGEGRARAGVSAATGGALGYLLVPGLLTGAGLVLSGAGAAALLGGPVLSALLAGSVAGLAAALAPHAPERAPYSGV